MNETIELIEASMVYTKHDKVDTFPAFLMYKTTKNFYFFKFHISRIVDSYCQKAENLKYRNALIYLYNVYNDTEFTIARN